MNWLSKKILKYRQRLIDTRDLYMGRLAIGRAELSAVLIKADGTRIDKGVICRKRVTGVFVTDIIKCLAKASPYDSSPAAFQDYKYHRAGIATTAESNANTISTFNFTGCPTYVAATQGAGTVDTSSATAPKYTSVATIAFTSTLAITEHGIFNSNGGSGVCMDRSVFTAINVVNGDSIQFTYALTINAEAD